MYGQGRSGQQFKAFLTPAVKYLLIINFAIFFLQNVLQAAGHNVFHTFGFVPVAFLKGAFWQILTYPFLHGGLFHLMINMFMLYMFAPHLEKLWGTKKFCWYYVFCAIGGAVLHTFIWIASFYFVTDDPNIKPGVIPIVGASGALYGLIMAFARLFGEAQVLAFFIIPMKMKTFAMLIIFIEIVSAINSSESGVAHLVHLGGLAAGFLIIKFFGKDLHNFPFGGGGGGGWGRRRKRQDTAQRLNVILGGKHPDNQNKDHKGKYPITWN